MKSSKVQTLCVCGCCKRSLPVSYTHLVAWTRLSLCRTVCLPNPTSVASVKRMKCLWKESPSVRATSCSAVRSRTVWWCSTEVQMCIRDRGDFLIAFRHEVCYFIQDAFYVTAALASTSIGHDTIGAEVIAATHDGYKTRNMIAADTRRNHIPISLGSR